MDKKELSKELAKHGVGIMEMKIEEENLEDYFRKLVEIKRNKRNECSCLLLLFVG